MSVVINTNVDSLKIQSTLTNATSKLSQAMLRISNGLKINSAKDDAAGTVISSRMEVQLDGNKICQNNIQNANAMLSTAEGNIDTVLNNVVRIRDLTLEAKNGTYSPEEKAALQNEVKGLISEINRISQSSKYSQLKLFGDETGLATSGATFQVGANSDTYNTISIENTQGLFDTLEFTTLSKERNVINPTQLQEVKENGIEVGEATKLTINTLPLTSGTAIEISTAVKTLVDDNDLRAGDVIYSTKAQNEGFYKISYDSDAADDQQWSLTEIANCNDGTRVVYQGALENLDKIKELDDMKVGDVYYDKKNDKYYQLKRSTAEHTAPYWEDVTATIAKSSKERIFDNKDFDLTTMTVGMGSGSFAEAIDTLDEMIDNLTGRKAIIGSAQGRLDSALDTLTTQFSNLTSAKSVITDADIASEASNFTQNQILQQVSTSLLAQANQAPSVALSLL